MSVKTSRTLVLALCSAIIGGMVLSGCSSTPADETKPVNDPSGAKPTAAGGSGPGAAAGDGSASTSGAAKPQ